MNDFFSLKDQVAVINGGTSGIDLVDLIAGRRKLVVIDAMAGDAEPGTGSTTYPMTLDPATGVWRIEGGDGWTGQYYLFEVEVYVPSTGQVENNLDPQQQGRVQVSCPAVLGDATLGAAIVPTDAPFWLDRLTTAAARLDLSERDGGNPDHWFDVRQRLPLLAKKAYYETVRHGFARGSEPVHYVDNIRNFYELLVWHTSFNTVTAERSKHPPITEAQDKHL